MSTDEQSARIRELVELSDQGFETGERMTGQMIAADMLWGAFARGLIAVAKVHGWECYSEQHMKDVADKLAERQDLPGWRQDFEAAAQLQQHFLHGHMNEADLADARQSTKRAALELLRIIEEEGPA